MQQLTIGQLARDAAVGVETVRFYERKGLIEQPEKPLQGYRHYPADYVQRIRFIRQAQALGFSLREIDELLLISSDPESNCATMRQRAAGKLEEVQLKIIQLQQLETVLAGLVDSCPGNGGLDGCTILEAIETPTGAQL